MKYKTCHCNNYRITIELLLLVILCFSTVCCTAKQTQQVLPPNGGNLISEQAVNLNTASAAELEKLPSIGEKRAQKIVEFRQKYGNFRRAEDLILVDGISDRKFRQIRHLVKTE